MNESWEKDMGKRVNGRRRATREKKRKRGREDRKEENMN